MGSIDSRVEIGDRGVYIAYDFGGPHGCTNVDRVIVKSWSESGRECDAEVAAYKLLCSPMLEGVPRILANTYDEQCQVHAIVMEKLGPSLQDILDICPDGLFGAKMVLSVAINMVRSLSILPLLNFHCLLNSFAATKIYMPEALFIMESNLRISALLHSFLRMIKFIQDLVSARYFV